MRSDQFFVSVIIPVYNGEKFLGEAIESVFVQNHSPLEIIIVDDGSTDSTSDVAKLFGDRVTCVYQENKGVPAARNKGLSLAKGNVIAFLDADDIWMKDKLKLQLGILSAKPETQIVISMFQRIYEKENSAGKTDYVNYDSPQISMAFTSSVIRRSVFDTIGLLNEKRQLCDDWDWFMRAREQGIKITTMNKVTILYRRHDNNITNNINQGNHHMLRMLKDSLDRRREMNNSTILPKLNQDAGNNENN